MDDEISRKLIDRYYNEILRTAKKGGYNLNPDRAFVDELIKGLITNKKRYGFEACPCRLCIGPEEENRDIICPCYYRDEDLAEYGCCYCGLYVNEEISRGEKQVVYVPERRDLNSGNRESPADLLSHRGLGLPYPVHRCNVCGYLCARKTPPERCPVCGADQKRFELFVK